MEIVNAHTTTKPNSTTMDFQQKTKVHNTLQHRKPSLLKRQVGKDLIGVRPLVAKKVCDLKKGDNCPLLCTLFFTLGSITFYNKNNPHFLYKFGCSQHACFFKMLVLWFLL
jgi:hypothetical protein